MRVRVPPRALLLCVGTSGQMSCELMDNLVPYVGLPKNQTYLEPEADRELGREPKGVWVA